MSRDDVHEVADLLDGICDGLHTAEDMRRLGDLLLQSPDARRFYHQALDLHCRLTWEVRGRDALPPLSLAQLRSEVEANTPPQLPEAAVPPGTARPTPLLARPITFPVLVAASTIVCLLIVASLIRLQTQTVSPPTSLYAPPQFVGRLIRTVDCHWTDGGIAKSEGSHLREGQTLELVSGIAEIQVRGGVRMILQGPALLRIEAPQLVQLDTGSLVSHVPSQAVGFTVSTPHATIVDRGTEFGVYVHPAEATEAHVFSGQVEIRSREADQVHPPQMIAAGQSRRVRASRPHRAALVESIAQDRAFVRNLSPASETMAADGNVLVKNLATGQVLFADDFESAPLSPQHIARAGHWQLVSPQSSAVQVTAAGEMGSPAPAQGRHCLRLFRQGSHADADIDAVFEQIQVTPGEAIHFEAMIYIPTGCTLAQILFRDLDRQQISLSLLTDAQRQVNYFDSTPGIAESEAYRPTGLEHPLDQWHKWEIDYRIGTNVAAVTIAGRKADIPISVPMTSVLSVGFRVGRPQASPMPFYIDAVPAAEIPPDFPLEPIGP